MTGKRLVFASQDLVSQTPDKDLLCSDGLRPAFNHSKQVLEFFDPIMMTVINCLDETKI